MRVNIQIFSGQDKIDKYQEMSKILNKLNYSPHLINGIPRTVPILQDKNNLNYISENHYF